jgi:hypothetical protein
MLLIGAGFVVVLTIGVIALISRNDGASVEIAHPSGSTPSEGEIAPPGIPAFGFAKPTRELVRTSAEPIKKRDREASERAATAARVVLLDLYTEGFLDPANWEQGRYADAFRGFASGARTQAEARPGLLTAGVRAGDRYDRILPVSGRLATRVLLDRTGQPTLLVSVVRFTAKALGPEPVTLRSNGQFFFERIGGSWKIMSFHVTRTDAPREGA